LKLINHVKKSKNKLHKLHVRFDIKFVKI